MSLGLQQMSTASSPGSDSTATILSLLLDLAVAKKDALAQASMDQLASIAHGAVSDTLKIMSAKDFVHGVLAVVESGQPQVCASHNNKIVYCLMFI